MQFVKQDPNFVRRKRTIKMEWWEMALEIVTAMAMAALLIFTLVTYKSMPEQVAVRFGTDHLPELSGGKSETLILIGVILAFYVVFTGMSRVPHMFNYVVKLCAENELVQYKMALIMIRIVRAEVVFLFGYYHIKFMQGAISGVLDLPLFYEAMMIAVVLLSVIMYMGLARKKDKKMAIAKYNEIMEMQKFSGSSVSDGQAGTGENAEGSGNEAQTAAKKYSRGNQPKGKGFKGSKK